MERSQPQLWWQALAAPGDVTLLTYPNSTSTVGRATVPCNAVIDGAERGAGIRGGDGAGVGLSRRAGETMGR